MNVITPNNMRLLERHAMDELGIDELVLMENAAHGLACELVGVINSEEGSLTKVTMLSGVGNNGGDVLAASRILLEETHGLIVNKKIELTICVVGDCSKFSEAAKHNIDRLREVRTDGKNSFLGVKVVSEMNEEEFPSLLKESNLIVDGIFGIGLSRPIEKIYKFVVDTVNEAREANKNTTVIAVDVPSGLDANNGLALGSVVKADITVTMQAVKTGMLMNDGPDVVGEIKVVSIFEPFSTDCVDESTIAGFYDVETEYDTNRNFEKYLLRRKNSNKGTYGRVLCICGSDEMRGAASLAVKAAFAVGSGLVYVASVRQVWDSCSVICPEAVGMILKENAFGGIDGYDKNNLFRIKEKLSQVDAVLIGPGMMNDKDGNTRNLVKFVLENAAIPVLIDADGLNASVGLNNYSSYNCPAVIVTPHPGEMGRLMDRSITEAQRSRVEISREFAKNSSAITLLKGCGTVIVCDGKTYINTTGGPALAVAGSGDSLAGMMVGLVAQYLKNDPEQRRETIFDAVKTAAYLHGLLGNEAEADESIGSISAVPSKMIEKLSFILEREKKNVSRDE